MQIDIKKSILAPCTKQFIPSGYGLSGYSLQTYIFLLLYSVPYIFFFHFPHFYLCFSFRFYYILFHFLYNDFQRDL